MTLFIGYAQLCDVARKAQKGTLTNKEKGPLVLMVLTALLIVAPLDLATLACAVVGAALYAVFNMPAAFPGMRSAKPKVKVITDDPPPKSFKNLKHASPMSTPMPTAMPITAPKFEAADFSAQADELVRRISPTPDCNFAVEELAAVIRQKIKSLIPEAEVMGFSTGDLQGSAAYGVAVPDVDIVASVSPADLTKRLQGRLAPVLGGQRKTAISRLDNHKLQKSAIRVCTSLLVSVGFKFRRSCFRSEEPKVTLLAPASLGPWKVSIPIDFSINITTPLYNMALLTECGQMDHRAKSLILLVKRFAKDRGICHASKGHFPPYAWSLFSIYYLQVGIRDEDGGLPLPALDSFAVSSGLITAKHGAQVNSKQKSKFQSRTQRRSVADLFAGFVRFYNREFDQRKEAVSVRLGKRGPPNQHIDIHVLLKNDGSTTVSPTIEDPFDSKKNLGGYATEFSLQRFTEELSRADDLLSRERSLTELLEPWRPVGASDDPNQSQLPDEDDDDELSAKTL